MADQSLMLDRFGTNPTQLTGLLSFAAATIACVIAARRSFGRDARIWQLLAFMNGLFLIEIFIGLRHRVHNYVDALLMAEGQYGQRRGMQESMIIGLATIGLVCMAILLFSRRLERRRAGSCEPNNCSAGAVCHRDGVATCTRCHLLSANRPGAVDWMVVGHFRCRNMLGGPDEKRMRIQSL